MATPPPGYGPPTPGWGYGPPTPPPRRRPDWLLPAVITGSIGLVALVLLIVATVTSGSGSSTAHATPTFSASFSPFTVPTLATPATLAPLPTGDSGGGDIFGSLEHPEDVELLHCARSAGLGWAGVDVKVTNHSGKPSAYYIKVSYTSPDTSVSYGDGWVSIDTLAPGQVTTRKAFPGQDVPAGAPLACTLTSARRTVA